MNPLKMLLLVIVSTGLACSAFAIERTRSSDTPSPAVSSPAAANGGLLVSTATAAVIAPGLPAEANYRLASTAAVQYAAVDAGRIGARAAANTGGDTTAPGAGRVGATPGASGFPAMPEPAEWMQLLCGLVIAGFIARRRTNVGAG
jgi:hypothetical protein